MAAGNAVRRNFPGMTRGCAGCHVEIIVTDQMCKHSKYLCDHCQSVRAVESAKRNRDRKRANNNAWHARNSNCRSVRTAEYRAKHPLKAAAHRAVQTAVRNGSLLPEQCAVCGSAKSHAHHDDYTKPLDVIWLCHTHHMEHHAMLSARQENRHGE